jgi:cysteine desulfurase
MWGHRRVYLDRASGVAGNPSSAHEEGRRARATLEKARRDIARVCEVQADDVIFTSGATESNALAVLGIPRALRARGQASLHVLYLPGAHASITENVRVLQGEDVAVEPLPIRGGRVDIEALGQMVRKETVLVAMEAVCGETGVVWNTREVRHVLDAARSALGAPRIWLHVDASQAPLTEKITRDHFGADTLTLDGSKVGEMRGIGVFIAHRTIPIEPLYKGGGQERGLRPGTESPELARGFATALTAATLRRESFRTTAFRNREVLMGVIREAVPEVVVHGGHRQAPHILNLSFPGRDTDYLVALLDEAGFAVSTRSACETDSGEGSRAVFALTGDREEAQTTLRVSWGEGVGARDLMRFARALERAVAFIDNKGHR